MEELNIKEQLWVIFFLLLLVVVLLFRTSCSKAIFRLGCLDGIESFRPSHIGCCCNNFCADVFLLAKASLKFFDDLYAVGNFFLWSSR